MNVVAEETGKVSIHDARTQAIERLREQLQTMTDSEVVEAVYDANATRVLIEVAATGRALPPCGICGEAIDDPRDAQVFKRSSDSSAIIAHNEGCFKSELSKIVSIAARPGGHALLRGLR